MINSDVNQQKFQNFPIFQKHEHIEDLPRLSKINVMTLTGPMKFGDYVLTYLDERNTVEFQSRGVIQHICGDFVVEIIGDFFPSFFKQKVYQSRLFLG